MKITTWNVNGLKSSFSNNISEYMRIINSDILCLQETKTTLQGVINEIDKLNEYYFFLSPCGNKNGYAGVGILSKLKPNNVVTKIGFPEFDNDGRFLQLDFPDFHMINVYMPLGAKNDTHYEFKLQSYKKLIEHVKEMKKPVFICGDFNIARDERDLYDVNQFINIVPFRDSERKVMEDLLSAGFVDTARNLDNSAGLFTWWSYFQNDRIINKGTRIDYILASKVLEDKLKSFKVFKEIFISDHAPLCVEVDFTTSAEPKSTETGNVFGGLF